MQGHKQTEKTKQKLREAWLRNKKQGKIGGNPKFELNDYHQNSREDKYRRGWD